MKDVAPDQKDRLGGRSRDGRRWSTNIAVLRFLAVAQVAIAILLTNGAIMLFKSYGNILSIPQVLHTEQVLTSETWLWGPQYEEKHQRAALADLLIEED